MACPSFSPPRSSIGWLPAGSIIRLVGVRPALWAVVGCGVRHLRRASACGHGLNLFLIASSQRLAGLALSPAASPVRQHRRRSSCGSPFASPSSSTPSSRAGVNNVPPPRAVQAVPGHRHPEASSHTAYVAVALEGFDGCASALLPLAKDEQVLVAKKGKRGWVFGWQLVADQDGSVVPGRSGWVPEAFLTPLRKFDCPHCVPGNARYLSTTESKAEAELAIAVRDMNAKLEAIYASVRIEQHARSKHDIELGVFQDSAPLSPALATDSTWQATMEQQNSERTSAAHDRPGEREAVTKARQYGRAPATKCLTLDASHFGHFQPHKQHGVAESRDMMPASISSTGRKPDPGLVFESGLPHPPSPPRDDPGDLLVSSPQALKADASSLTSAHQGSDDVPPIPGVRTWSLEAKTKVKGGAMAVSTSSELLNMQKMRAEVQAEVLRGKEIMQRELQRLAASKATSQKGKARLEGIRTLCVDTEDRPGASQEGGRDGTQQISSGVEWSKASPGPRAGTGQPVQDRPFRHEKAAGLSNLNMTIMTSPGKVEPATRQAHTHFAGPAAPSTFAKKRAF